jgi:hypothetical protein
MWRRKSQIVKQESRGAMKAVHGVAEESSHKIKKLIHPAKLLTSQAAVRQSYARQGPLC